MKYRTEIDGLRAVAVLPVIFFHAGFAFFSGGYIGVDVFFVISGYLITTIILGDIAAGKFTFSNFYERRTRRIIPALIVVMLVCVPFAYYWMLPSQLTEFSQSLIAVSLFGSNILFWLQTGYFATASDLKPLLHTWSLAVEEQYYLFFSFIDHFHISLWKARYACDSRVTWFGKHSFCTISSRKGSRFCFLFDSYSSVGDFDWLLCINLPFSEARCEI